MNPNELRDRVEEAIQAYIDWDIWERCELAEAAEKDTIRTVVGNMIISGLASNRPMDLTAMEGKSSHSPRGVVFPRPKVA
jgi:hypothetical protein